MPSNRDGHHVGMQELERQEAREESHATARGDDAYRTSRTDNIKQQYRKTMEEIRGLYLARRNGASDAVAFESLVQEPGIYEAQRYPLAKVTDALVRVSEKAKKLNDKFFGGRFR